MNANMIVSEQCGIAASKNNQIPRNKTYTEKSLIVPLHKAIVRSQLEYILLKLSEPFFDTTVGPRPNLARICG